MKKFSDREWNHLLYIANRDKLSARNRQYYQEHRAEIREKAVNTRRVYREKHPEKIQEYNRRYYYAHREELLRKKREKKAASGGRNSESGTQK